MQPEPVSSANTGYQDIGWSAGHAAQPIRSSGSWFPADRIRSTDKAPRHTVPGLSSLGEIPEPDQQVPEGTAPPACMGRRETIVHGKKGRYSVEHIGRQAVSLDWRPQSVS